MKYYIGIDGGGTKTLIRLINEHEETVDTFLTSGSNISSIGYMATEKVLKESINELLSRNSLLVKDCKGLCMGAAGVDRKKEKIEVEEILLNLGFENIKVVNDTQIVLRTVTNKKKGIVVIAGTGSIVMGIRGNKEARAGGWGYKLGDEGSAYWIGMHGIKAVLDAYDYVGKPTTLSKKILDYFDLKEPENFIELFYKNSISKIKIADISKIVDKEANSGDSVAIEVLRRSSHALGDQVIAVYKRIFCRDNTKIPVVLNGSVLLKSKVFNQMLVGYLENETNQFDIQNIDKDSSFGACRLAKELN